MTGGDRVLEGGLWRTITGVEDARPFREFVRVNPSLEFLVRHEVVVDPIGLAVARPARRQRD